MFFVFLAAISIMLISSCSSDSSTNPLVNSTDYGFTCTLNGGGYTNQAVKITTGTGSIYSSDDNQTAVTCTNVNTDVGIVSFEGNKTGTFQITNGEVNLVMITLAQSTYIAMTSGTINVTSYGNVGGDVVGTFSGQAAVVGGQIIQVTNGTFKAKRAL